MKYLMYIICGFDDNYRLNLKEFAGEKCFYKYVKGLGLIWNVAILPEKKEEFEKFLKPISNNFFHTEIYLED